MKLHFFPDAILRRSSLNLDDPDSGKIPSLKLLHGANAERKFRNGIAISSNQVGSLGNWFIMEDPNKDSVAIIHPTVTGVDGSGFIVAEEGCLSIPGFSSEVSRFHAVNISGLRAVLVPDRAAELTDENFCVLEPFDEVWTGYKARVAQHEYDHLRGILYTDKLHSTERSRIIGNLMALRRKGKIK